MCQSSAPDTSGLNQAAVDSAQLGQESLDWFKQYVAQTQPQRDATTAIDNQVTSAQLAGMQQAQQQAAELDARNKAVFQPVEDKLVADAQAYDTPERRQAAAAGAMSDVAQRAAATTASSNRALGRAGIAPGSAKSAAMNNDIALGTALGEQGAASAARNQVESTGHAMQMDAAGLGKGIIGSQATMLQTAANGGQAAMGASGGALAAATSAGPLMQTAYGQGMQGQQVAGNLYGQTAQINAMNNGSMLGGIGGIMQGIGSIWGSSKKIKTDKRPVSDKAALKAVNSVKVGAWKYKPGVEDGADHVGPYAEDVQKAMGDGVAPGGKVVNVARMQDINLQAIRKLQSNLAAVNKQIKRLEATA